MDTFQAASSGQKPSQSTGRPDCENRYLDTRGYSDRNLSFSEAIVQGLADGGGLLVPESIPRLGLEEILSLSELTYPEQAAHVFRAFGVDFSDEQILALLQDAYGDNFDAPDIAPVVEVAPNTFVLELWHGPTAAFKDMALQCLPHFFSAAIDKQDGLLSQAGSSKDPGCQPEAESAATATADNSQPLADASSAGDPAADDFQALLATPLTLILVATSGDTGSAALEGFRDRKHTAVIVFYPEEGVSDIQYRQMATVRGFNVGVVAVKGNFDDCQTAVKAAFNDIGFNMKLAQRHVQLSSANSINWGRMLPQIVYYASTYARLVAEKSLQPGEALDVSVPTGNFGNILAAWYAQQMGVPIRHFYCASNENHVLTDFINSGIYDITDRDFFTTPTPSMDILISSNLERQLFELAGRNTLTIRNWMESLRTTRRFQIDDATLSKLQEDFSAGWVSGEDSLQVIKAVYEQYGYLLDPHTAVAWKVAADLRPSPETPVLVVSTAHWAKFGADIWRALNGRSPNAPLPEDLAKLSGAEMNELIVGAYPKAGAIPSRLANLDNQEIRFLDVIEGTTTALQEEISDWLDHHIK